MYNRYKAINRNASRKLDKRLLLRCWRFKNMLFISFLLFFCTLILIVWNNWSSSPNVICLKIADDDTAKLLDPLVTKSNFERTVCINVEKKQLINKPPTKATAKGVEHLVQGVPKQDVPLEDNVRNGAATEEPEIINHPLETLCKYPVLHPLDESIIGYTKKLVNYTCRKVLPDIVRFKDGILSLNQEEAKKELGYPVRCRYRGLTGGLIPNRIKWKYDGEWEEFDQMSKPVLHSQIEVQCTDQRNNSFNDSVYKYAFAHVPPFNQTFAPNNETFLSLDILLFDSTSMNAVKRHMPKTWHYFTKVMGALELNGYFKVADNSMVNHLPLLTGLRYGNLSETMWSDYPMDNPLDWEKVPLLWKLFKDKNGVTMLNEDPVVPEAGIFQVPPDIGRGFAKKPTDYWFRPWNLYHRLNPIKNKTHLCFANDFVHNDQLSLVQQFISRYKDTYHFSHTHFNEIAHDDCSYLALIDDRMRDYFQQSFESGVFNKTVLVMVGDHGNRMGGVTWTFIGRIEERMPLIGFYFPEWFRKKHPTLMQNFKANKNRLTTHFDTYQVLKNIADGHLEPGFRKDKNDKTRGLSLLHNVVPLSRTCEQADVPENHCVCLIPAPDPKITKQIRRHAHDVILHYTQQKLSNFKECQEVDNVRILNMNQYTINRLIQHGIRWMHPDSWDQIRNKTTNPIIDYFEVEYIVRPSNMTALIRLQKDKENELFFVNVEPMVLTGVGGCPKDRNYLPNFCTCI